MKINQVSIDYVKEHLHDENIYRILICDDGKNGKYHKAVRIKPLLNLTLNDFNESIGSETCGFILISEE